MKNIFSKKVFGLLIVTFLSSCTSNGGSSWKDDDDYPLEYDGQVGYTIDESVSNENGSLSYEIFVRSFYDHNGDGTGDLLGVKDKIPYLKSLGVKTLWLLPIHSSPSYHGYDVIDYYSVNSDYGTINDFDELVRAANEANIDIMLDMVFNHTARANQWMQQSYNDKKNNNTSTTSKQDWYCWTTETGQYTYDYSGLRYYAYFDSGMPDLNLSSTSLREELDKVCKFWIQDHGVKGFRLDAILHYCEQDVEKNNEFLAWLSETTKKYNSNFYMVGEAWTGDPIVNNHYASGIESCFRFGTSVMGDENLLNLSKGYGNIKSIGNIIEQNETSIKQKNSKGYSSYFISNHDMDRPVFQDIDYEGQGLLQAKALASLVYLLPGTPFIYYGEEIQLVGKRNTSPDDRSDVKRRLPMIWSKSDKTGECKFPESNRKDLDNTDQVELGVNDQLEDPNSLVNHYRYVANIRNKYPMLKMGTFKTLYKKLSFTEGYMYDRVMAYQITLGNDSIIIVHNFSMYNCEFEVLGSGEILDSINTTNKVPTIKDGKVRLGSYSSVILKA